MSENLTERLLSAQEAADRVGVHRRTIYVWVASGALPRVKIGPKRLRFWPEDVDAMVRHETVGKPAVVTTEEKAA